MVDFHCRVMCTCVYTHVNFIRVNRIQARHKVLSLNGKLSEVQFSPLHDATLHTLPLFYLRTSILYTYARKNYATVKIHPKSKNSWQYKFGGVKAI